MAGKQNEVKDVQPIRSLDRIEDMKWSLKKWCGERDYILFLLGTDSGLRVGDLLNIKVSEIQGKQVVSFHEGETSKSSNIYDELDDAYKREKWNVGFVPYVVSTDGVDEQT